jgi:hypothetical protein
VKYTLALSVLLLAGCAHVQTPEPIVVTKTVEVPVSVPCVPGTYTRTDPEYVDTDTSLKTADDAAIRYQLLWAGRDQRIAREGENKAVISGCIGK